MIFFFLRKNAIFTYLQINLVIVLKNYMTENNPAAKRYLLSVYSYTIKGLPTHPIAQCREKTDIPPGLFKPASHSISLYQDSVKGWLYSGSH